MANDGRKSLMITTEAHAQIMQLSQTFGVSQPDLVDALLRVVDKARLQSNLTELAASRVKEQEDRKRKQALLEQVAGALTTAQLEALLKQAGKSA